MSPRILLFARRPRVGRVKTRLVPAIGAPAAARLHEALLRHAMGNVAASGFPATLYSDGRIDFGPPWPWRAQQGADLGERMWRAIGDTAAEGDTPILIGSDCPDIDGSYLAAAVRALDDGADLVLGPAEDGGYALIGSRGALPRSLFEGVRWGGSDVLRQTLASAAACGLTVHLLDRISDVDRPADLGRLADRYPEIIRAAGLGPADLEALGR